jgi:uncharacterized protein YaaW (UPF0174 family)
MKSKSVKKNAKMIVDEFLEEGGLFEDEEFWEEMNGIKRKKMEKEVGEKMEVEIKEEEENVEMKEEEMEVKEEGK